MQFGWDEISPTYEVSIVRTILEFNGTAEGVKRENDSVYVDWAAIVLFDIVIELSKNCAG